MPDLLKFWWAMLDSNQRPHPCENRKVKQRNTITSGYVYFSVLKIPHDSY